jgi:formate hydrogenlyase subunit 6/NADH:ubiquinone oxidoreductase subunit I
MIGMAKGMVVTLRHMLSPAFTADYPWKKRVLPERSRTSFALAIDEDGTPLCKSCMLCEKSCPVDAIEILSEKREDGPGRVLQRFTLDMGLCMYCGLCVENCTSMGLSHAGDYEILSPVKADLKVVLYEAPGGVAATSVAGAEDDAS